VTAVADLLLIRALAVAIEAGATWCTFCFLVDKRAEVAGSWAEGLAWLAARRGNAAALAAAIARVAVSVALWLLALAVRPTGKHRAEVA